MDSDSVFSVLTIFQSHPSIKNIKSNKFNLNLNVAKSCQINYIPTKVIKMNRDIFANLITDHFNNYIAYGEIPDELKHTDVIAVHKKNEKCDKTNYIPASILTNIFQNL